MPRDPDTNSLFDSPAWRVYNSRHVLRLNCDRTTTCRGSLTMKKTIPLLSLFSILLLACTPDIPQLPPAEVISRAGDAMLAAPSFHFKIDISGAPVVLNKLTQLTLRSAEGDFARPDKMGVHLKVIAAVAAAELDMIALGNEQYLTNVLTKKWEVLPPEFGFNPAIMFDPKVGLEQLLEGRPGQSALDRRGNAGRQKHLSRAGQHRWGARSGHERRLDQQRSGGCRSVD